MVIKKILLFAIVLNLVLHLIIGITIFRSNPKYMSDYNLNENPDAVHYVTLGINFISSGQYTRMNEPPYQPELLRTPVFPLIAGLLTLLGNGPWLVYIFHMILHIATGILIYSGGKLLFDKKIAQIASCCYLLNLTLIISNFETMSEPLFNFLLTASLVLTLRLFKSERNRLYLVCITGILTGIAILTRPVGLYIPFIIIIGLLWNAFQRSGMKGLLSKKPLVNCLFYILFTSSCILPWIYRNAKVFDVPKLSSVDATNYVYYFGAGAYQIKYGIELEQAQQKIEEEFNLSSNLVHHNPWMTNKTIKELDTELRKVTVPVLLKYPKELVHSSIIGSLKAAFAHNSSIIAYTSGKEYFNPGFARLKSGDISSFLNNLFKNQIIVVFSLFFQPIFMFLVWLFSAIGLIHLIKTQKIFDSKWVIVTLVTCYFLLTITLGGLEATYRFRSVIIPLLCFLAANGFDPIIKLMHQKKS